MVNDAMRRDIGDRIFVNEDLSRPENRINVAMFGLLAQDWFRLWMLSMLGMSEDAVIYPPTNTGEARPDLTVEDPVGRKTLGWIEVEVRTDAGQASRYRDRFQEPVKTIWGRDCHGGDLSLECIAASVKDKINGGSLAPQAELHALLLQKLIESALGEANSTSKPVAVSEQMKRDHWFVNALINSLGDLLDFDLKPAVAGRLKANSRGDSGFSLRVFSRKAKKREVSILSVRNGSDDVHFSTRAHLKKYLPHHDAAIAAWVDQVRRIGGEIDTQNGKQIRVRFKSHTSDELMADVVKCITAFSRLA